MFGEYIDIYSKYSKQIKKYKIIRFDEYIPEKYIGKNVKRDFNSYYAIFQSDDNNTIKLRKCKNDYIGKECYIKSNGTNYCRNKFEIAYLDIYGVIGLIIIIIFTIIFYVGFFD